MLVYLQKAKSFDKNLFFVGILSATEEKSSVRIQIRIRTKMSRIQTLFQMSSFVLRSG
jgi:hypothetical protein